ncbi:hypothetical protein Cgig2_013679 [Carnegiea gigantea]|uniref:Uncharacterized protein n=1 Tax=Carnegiea gigantea TaxID=171969 RepID=A0A9Q1KE60_9CARY|nr:hypothetical protein Cgig2_013679 [Carnegiea gigantea]
MGSGCPEKLHVHMTDTIPRQVSEHVKRAMEATNSSRPLPRFDYLPAHACEPPHRPEEIPSPCYTEWRREVSGSDRSSCPYMEQPGRRVAIGPTGRPCMGTPHAPKTTPMTVPPKLQNVRKYYEFYEQSGYTTTECRELKKALHELADKGQINRFLKKGLRFLRREQAPAQPQLRDEECLTEVVATIAGGYAKRITRSAWKAQFRSAQQVLTTEQGPREANPTGMIRLPVCFGNKLRSKNLEVDFLVVDMPMAYNVILGRLTLHKVKAVIALYLISLQFEADDSSVGEIHGDQDGQGMLLGEHPALGRASKGVRTRGATPGGEAGKDWVGHHGS